MVHYGSIAAGATFLVNKWLREPEVEIALRSARPLLLVAGTDHRLIELALSPVAGLRTVKASTSWARWMRA